MTRPYDPAQLKADAAELVRRTRRSSTVTDAYILRRVAVLMQPRSKRRAS